MIDITHKISTKRVATASAIVKVGSTETIDRVRDKQVPKGDVLEMAKTAGLFAVKNTANSIPDCHPLPVEFTKVEYFINREVCEIKIMITVGTVYKTGVEVEAMHGASIIALTIYDMLKPIDKHIEIKSIKLESKKGGKSDYQKIAVENIRAAVVVCSDSVFTQKKEDTAGKSMVSKLSGIGITHVDYEIINDDREGITETCKRLIANNIDLVLFTGGTGLSDRDNTPEAVQPLFDKELPGVAEQLRNYGMQRMPYAMLSRSVAGVVGNSIIVTFPGSLGGANDGMVAIFPSILHAFEVLKNKPHSF